MLRSTFDRLMSYAGLLLAALLIIVSGLAFWGYSFANGTVSDQLSAQKITMPAGAALDALPAEDKAALLPFASTPMDDGDKAKAYADHYILAHMMKASGGKTYSQISGDCKNTDPLDSPACRLKYNTMFTGDALRSMLLTAYAFGTIAKIALVGAIATLLGGLGMLLLSLLGLRHAKNAGDAVVGGAPAPAARIGAPAATAAPTAGTVKRDASGAPYVDEPGFADNLRRAEQSLSGAVHDATAKVDDALHRDK